MENQIVEGCTNTQELLFQLAGEVESTKAHLKYKQEKLEKILLSLDVNTHPQDSITGVVYKVYVPEGTFVNFKKVDVKRTALPGEVGGTFLSKKEAEAAGFVVSK